MKLVELLARELKAWPVVGGVEPNYIVQEGDKELYSTTIRPIYRGPTTWHRAPNDKAEDCGYFDVTTADLAEDWSTAIVTRTDWAAERARIAKPAKKADKDGWIRHRGGKCPVEAGTVIEYRERNGNIEVECEPELLGSMWFHENHPHDIMAYRLHKPAEQVDGGIYAADDSVSTEQVAVSYIGESVQGPLQWRDRITEIDATTHSLTTERADLVQRLASEGFALIGRAVEPVEPVEDMSDWRNWKVGDIVECVSHNERWSAKFAIGSVNVIKEIITDSDVAVELTINIGYYVSPYDFKFHSRPSA